MEFCDWMGCEGEAYYHCDCREAAIRLCTEHRYICDRAIEDHSIELKTDFSEYIHQAKSKFLEVVDRIKVKREEELQREIQKAEENCENSLRSLDTHMDSSLCELEEALLSRNLSYKYKNKIISQYSITWMDQILEFSENSETNSSQLIWSLKNFMPFSNQEHSYRFMDNSKTLEIINNKNLTVKYKDMDSLPDKVGYLAGICVLNDGTLFYCGGFLPDIHYRYLSSCYLINPLTFDWEQRADVPSVRNNIIPLQVEDYVYIFGGHYMGNLSLASRYSLSKNCWESLSDLPKASRCVCSVIVQGNILLAGMETDGIYYYYIQKDKYELVFQINKNRSYGTVLAKTNSGDLFCLTNREVYKSSEFNYKKWTLIGKFNHDFQNIENQPQVFEDFICFRVWQSRYVRFNYKTMTYRDVTFGNKRTDY